MIKICLVEMELIFFSPFFLLAAYFFIILLSSNRRQSGNIFSIEIFTWTTIVFY